MSFLRFYERLIRVGIGGFTILDGKVTDGEDVGVSFFLERGSIGRGRGEEACALINEMNPDVKGDFFLQVCTRLRDGEVDGRFLKR